MKFGAHMSTGGGVWRALERGASISCEVIQIFLKNNMQWFGKPYAPADLTQFAEQRAITKPACIFGHAGYLINLAAPPSDNRNKSIQSLIEEIQLADSLELPFIVLHPGSHLGAGEESGIERVVAGLNEVIRATRDLSVRIALENTAGQGSCLGSQISHLSAIYDAVERPNRLGICLDTAHFFAAGYDIRTRRGWESAIDEVDKLMGVPEVLAFHLNDSKTDLGSRVDRHAGIGEGKIGQEAFRHIINDPRFRDLPGCLETPKSKDLHEDVQNLAVLRSLIAKRKREKSDPFAHQDN